MIVSTVEQLLEMSDGAKPEAIRGKLLRIQKPKGTANGTMQKGTLGSLVPGSQATIEIIFMGRPEIIGAGEEIYCVATKGQRGLSGLSRKVNEYPQGKFNAQVWVYDKAEVAVGSETEETPGPGQQQPQPAASNASGPAKPAQQPSGGGSGGGGQQAPQTAAPATSPEEQAHADEQAVKAIKRNLFKDATLLAWCVEAAGAVVVPAMQKVCGGVSEESVQDLAATLFIQATRRGDNANVPKPPKKAAAAETAADNGN